MTSNRVLVLLSTGKQGQGVVRQLSGSVDALGRPFQVLALTRNTESDKAQELASLPGVQLLKGTTSTPEAVETTFSQAGPLDGLVLIQQDADTHPGGYEGEIQEAKWIIDAAKKQGIRHVVYHGMELGGLTESPHVYVQAKLEVDKYVRQQSEEGEAYKWTILRPCNFFDNLLDTAATGFMITLLTKIIHQPIQWIATADIAFFSAQSLKDPVKWHGKTPSLAGDFLSRQKFEEEWKAAGLQESALTSVPEQVVRNEIKGHPIEGLMEFINTAGNGQLADIGALKKEHPQLMDFPTFLRKNADVLRKAQ